jgi:3-phosphoshikimate 1-carboxyvinyltransferase
MSSRIIQPARSVRGTLRLPGDKSISHRYAMLTALAEGSSQIANYSTGADCASTLGCLRALGVPVHRDGNTVTIEGRGLHGLQPASSQLDAGNSGSTIRMLTGILAGQSFSSTISGDESLSRRPMKRIIAPLTEMGASIEAQNGGLPPLRITGGALHSIDYTLPVASAQVKTAVLFAGLYADGVTTVHQPLLTRNHSELALWRRIEPEHFRYGQFAEFRSGSRSRRVLPTGSI